MKNVLLIIFGLASLWDGFTTVIGTDEYLNPNNIMYNIFVAIVILSFMVATKFIWTRDGASGTVMKILWFIALFYDILTSYSGNMTFVSRGSNDEMLFLLGMTILTSASPVIVSFMFDE